MFLTRPDVIRLTGKARYTAQRRALDGMGIPYTRAATGEPLVRDTALDAGAKVRRNGGFRWDRIGQ